ncbi:MAG: hypothetical protein KGL39_30775 [Patescibacteria group bacterium]|nr:hypothetical protein [Patescibacteria group bacterium]
MNHVLHPEIISALDGEWRTAREVHARLGVWAQTSVRNMLRDLARAEIIETTTTTTPSGFVWLYRTKAP